MSTKAKTLRWAFCPPVLTNRALHPCIITVNNVGLYIDKRLNWIPHTRMKHNGVKIRYYLLKRLLDKCWKSTLNNKVLLYYLLFKPIWTHGLELWVDPSVSTSIVSNSFNQKYSVVKLILIFMYPSYL